MNKNEKQQAIELGQRFAIILSQLSIKDETRQVILDFVSALNMKQIQELVDLFERKYLESSTFELDENLRRDLESIKKEMDQKNKEIDNETISSLKDLESKIDSQS